MNNKSEIVRETDSKEITGDVNKDEEITGDVNKDEKITVDVNKDEEITGDVNEDKEITCDGNKDIETAHINESQLMEGSMEDADEFKDDGEDDEGRDDSFQQRGREEEEDDRLDEGRHQSASGQSESAVDAFDAFEFVRKGEPAQDTCSGSTTQAEEIPPASDWLDGDKLNTVHVNTNRRYVAVDYPGVIVNKDKAVATLGGMEMLNKVVSEELKMELFFRPQDPFCKPTIGSFIPTRNLLLKIRRRPKVTSDGTGDGFEYQVEVLGTVDKVYVFEKLCDFQYLPVVKGSDGSFTELLSRIRPTIHDDRVEFLSRKVPLFLPPFSFSRREISVAYNFEPDVLHPGEENETYIAAERKKRAHGTIHVSFFNKGVPREPDPAAFQQLKKIPNQSEAITILKKLFDERPIWTKAGLMAHVDKIYHANLKFMIPIVSFYFVNGPWKNLWCKFGYDPKTDPKAKIYQTLDYRVRTTVNRQRVEAKRGQEVLRSYQYGLKQKHSFNISHSQDLAKEKSITQNTSDLTYIFKPNCIPPYRQMRYQVCDVQHEEVQRRVHENDGQETVCTERDGWCVPDFTDTCRDIISAEVEKLFTR